MRSFDRCRLKGSNRLEGFIQVFLAMAGAASSADFPGCGLTRFRDPKRAVAKIDSSANDRLKADF
jgi:hypothetical protein